MEHRSCHICDCPDLHEVIEYAGFRRITSDFRLWPANGRLAVCEGCGAVQKVVDAAWREDCRAIYSTYVVYRQGVGGEQVVFASSGAGEARSRTLLRRLAEHFRLPEVGRHLDFGCGDGSLLRNAAIRLPDWARVGAEINENRRPEIEAIPGVVEFHAGSPDNISADFDLLTVVHVLEHFENPANILSVLAGKLKPSGRLVVEVPDLRSNPFDLLIADHATHFTAPLLEAVLVRAGCVAETLTDTWISRELSAVTRKSAPRPSSPIPWRESVALVEHHLDWLDRLRISVRSAAAVRPVGLFGTSIAATWVAAHVEDALGFFVDEDPQRIGTTYLGRPVLHPSQVAPGETIFIAHTPSFARGVMPRLGRRSDIRLVAPPEFQMSIP